MQPRDPWQALAADWPRVQVFIRYLPDRFGQTVWGDDRPYIELAHDLGPVQQRCTLAHEMCHLDLGKPCSSFCGTNEREVVEATARWLLPDLVEVGQMLRRFDIAAAAERLGVTRQVLNDRLLCLTDAEVQEMAGMVGPGADGEGTRAADGPRRTGRRPLHRCKTGGGRVLDQPPRARNEHPAS